MGGTPSGNGVGGWSGGGHRLLPSNWVILRTERQALVPMEAGSAFARPGRICSERGAARTERCREGNTVLARGRPPPAAAAWKFQAATCPGAHTRALTRALTRTLYAAAGIAKQRLGNNTSAMPPPPRATGFPALPRPAGGTSPAFTAPRPRPGAPWPRSDPVPF